MKTDTFSLLLQSAAEMRAIRRGERKPARFTRVESDASVPAGMSRRMPRAF